MAVIVVLIIVVLVLGGGSSSSSSISKCSSSSDIIIIIIISSSSSSSSSMMMMMIMMIQSIVYHSCNKLPGPSKAFPTPSPCSPRANLILISALVAATSLKVNGVTSLQYFRAL